jgi:hypothetical protein
MMNETTFEIEVQDDHVETISQTRKPILALSELLWNAVDADAERVDVTIEHDDLGGIRAIEVSDDGHGMPRTEAPAVFGKLGGSWKRARRYTKGKKRLLHGQEGKGRLRSFSLGRVVDWTVRYNSGDELREYTISIIKDEPRRGNVSPETSAQPPLRSGTTVRITEVHGNFRSLQAEEAPEQIAVIFALYLRQYPSVRIFYNGAIIDPRAVEDRSEVKPLPDIETADGKTYPCELEIVEWKINTARRLFLCNAGGFPIDEAAPGIQAPGFQFTAYLKSDYFAELLAENAIGLADMDPAVDAALTSAKAAMRDHFRTRAEEQARGLVEQWKEEKIYPFASEPGTEVERKERQVFDITALNVAIYLPKFQEAEPKAKQLQLRLLRHAIETGPEEALRFLTEVLDLPPERRQDLAALLDRTTLSEIISATKLITDRLEFLQGLQELIFSPDFNRQTKERSQLHRILAPNAWIFGEQYHIAVDDQNLTSVLRKHKELLREDIVIDDPVRREDGSDGVVDLMFSRCMAQPGVTDREHLVVELKRPRVPIGTKEAEQIESYADAVATDPRFRDTETRWVFWAVSTEITDKIRRRASQRGRAKGILYQSDDVPSITVWAKSWAEIIEDAQARMRFFQERLNYTPDRDTSLEHLRQTYNKHVGELIATKDHS